MSDQADKILTIDRVCDNRFHVYFKPVSTTYHCYDEESGKTRLLHVKQDKKRKSEFIRFSYHQNGKRRYYHKTIAKIRWELFQEWSEDNGRLVGLSETEVQGILKQYIADGGTVSTLTRLKHSENELVRKVHLWIERNGGKEKFYEVTKGLDIEPALYLFDRQQNLLKSSFEFITFALLDHNGIRYDYEPFKIRQYIPDFYIPKDELVIEILGLGTRWEYQEKSQKKSAVYEQEGFDYLPIHVDGKKPLQSIQSALARKYRDLKSPEISDYYQSFARNYTEFISLTADHLTDIVDCEESLDNFVRNHRSLYNHCIDRWGSIFEAVRELVGYPFGLRRPDRYWDSESNVRYELEMVWKEFKRIPSNTEAQSGIAERYGLRSLYQYCGGDAVVQGEGPFGDFLETLKLKYGFHDIRKEDEIASREKHLEILNRVFSGHLSATGKNSLQELHRSTYNWVFQRYPTIFDALKSEFGYPPPHVRRPGGYYTNPSNIEYELAHLWPLWLYVPEYAEVNGENGPKWTWNSLFAAAGREAFLEGGKYSHLITSLKKEFGSRDRSAERREIFKSRFMEYLTGVNCGNHLVAGGSETLGDFQKYADYAVAKYGSVFSAIAVLIGRPNHWVNRPRGYFDSEANCRQEIEWVKSDYQSLPKFSMCKSHRKDLNGLLGVYERHKSKAFLKDGIFYDLVKDWR